MRWRAYDWSEWKRYFAIVPVECDDGTVVWLSHFWCRNRWNSPKAPSEYRATKPLEAN